MLPLQAHKLARILVLKVALLALLNLGGCESIPSQASSTSQPKSHLQFIDFQGFDRDLSAALAAPLEHVDIAFHDKVTPSAMPPRLQTWIAAIDSGGGAVTVVPPKPSVAPKTPMLLIGLVSSFWTATQAAKDMAEKAQYNAARVYDASILLKLDEKGESIVDKVVFSLRKK